MPQRDLSPSELRAAAGGPGGRTGSSRPPLRRVGRVLLAATIVLALSLLLVARGGGQDPLSASFEQLPESHDGQTAFTFHVRFSEAISISFATLRDEAFEIDGGSISRARRVDGSSALWELTVAPTQQGDIVIALPPTGDCAASGAVCTAGGEMLSNRAEATVAGPESDPQDTPVNRQFEPPQTEDFDPVVSPDAEPTVMSSAIAAGGLSVTITFSEALSETVTPGVDRFLITIAGGTAAQPSAVSVSEATVTLTSAALIRQGQTVSVTYTDPNPSDNDTSGVLESADTDGTDVATFTEDVDPLAITEQLTLIKNTRGTSSASVVVAAERSYGTPFDTGPRTGGYQIKRVGIELTMVTGSNPEVSIYSVGSDNLPDAEVFRFENPSSLQGGGAINWFNAPADSILAADTRYVIVFRLGDLSLAHLRSREINEGYDGGDYNSAIGFSVPSGLLDGLAETNGVWDVNSATMRFELEGTGADGPIRPSQLLHPVVAGAPRTLNVTVRAAADAVETAVATAYDVDYKRTSDTDWIRVVRADETALSETLDGLLAQESYDVRARGKTTGYYGEWSSPIAATTGGTKSSDSTLSALSLSGVTLGETFAPATTSYTGDAVYATPQTTVTATAANQYATITSITPADADDETDGHQVDLGVLSATTISVVVTAEDGTTTTYTVAVTRAKIRIESLIPQNGMFSESDGTVGWIVRVGEAPLEQIGVVVRFAGKLGVSGEQTVNFAVGERFVTYQTPIPDDDIYGNSGEATATLVLRDDLPYTADSELVARKVIADDDFPAATATITVVSPEFMDGARTVAEGGTVTYTFEVLTDGDTEPFGGSSPVRVIARSGTATSGQDFAVNERYSIPLANFTRVDIDDDPDEEDWRWRFTQNYSFDITDDDIREPNDETFTLNLERVTVESPGDVPTAASMTLATPTSYTITIAPSDLETNNNLSALSVSTGTLSPTFDADTTSYTLDLPFATSSVRITATRAGSHSTLQYFQGMTQLGTDNAASVNLSNLPVNTTRTITVRVTPEDGSAAKDYTVRVTRALPVASIERISPAEVTEGGTLRFRISLDGPAVTVVGARASFRETGDMLERENQATANVPVQVGTSSTTYTSTLVRADDDVWEVHSTITASINSRAGYTVSPTMGTATVEMLDDDFPEAEATLSLSTTSASENDDQPGQNGDTVTATVTILTARDEMPHEGGGQIQLSLGTDDDPMTLDATSADYTVTGSRTLSFPMDEFQRVDLDDTENTDWRYRLTKSIQIKIVNDTARELAERFTVTMSAVTSGSSPTDSEITLSGDATQVITIPFSDVSSDASLTAISLSQGALSTPFTSGTTSYDATVEFDHEQITITPTAAQFATFQVLDSSDNEIDDSTQSGIQVNLPLNSARTVKVVVTAEDGETVRTYTFDITRQLPVLTISVANEARDLAEGGDVVVTITRNGVTDESTEVDITFLDDGNRVLPANKTARSLIIVGGDNHVEFAIPTDDDDDWDDKSDVGLRIDAAPARYTISGNASVSRNVTDDDFPDATASFSVVSTDVNEGDAVMITFKIETLREEEPNEDAGALVVTTSDGPKATDIDTQGTDQGGIAVAGSDYMAFNGIAIPFPASGFTLVNGRYVSEQTGPLRITDDTADEFKEGLTVTLSRKDADPNQTDENITLSSSNSIYLVIARSDLSNDPGLSSAGHSVGTLERNGAPATIVPDVTDYDISVPFEHEEITFTPRAQTSGATFDFLDADDEELTTSGTSVTVELEVNTATVVKIKVTSQDESDSRTYVFTVTRREPVVSIMPVSTNAVIEGAEIAFTVMLDGPAVASGGRSVMVALSETGGNVLPASPPTEVTVPMGQDRVRLAVTTVNDDLWEEHSTVTATLVAGTGYSISEEPGENAASYTVNDNDFPVATVNLEVLPNPVTEPIANERGVQQSPSSAAAQVTITTARDELPHEGAGQIAVSTADVSAVAGDDYTALSGSLVSFGLGDFVRDPVRGVYEARQTVAIPILHDNIEESDEAFETTIALVTTGSSPTDTNVTPGTTSETVTIAANDEHRVTDVAVQPSGRSAEVTVTIANPSLVMQTVHVAYFRTGFEQLTKTVSQSTSGLEVTFADSTPLTGIDLIGWGVNVTLNASLDPDFPTAKTTTVTFDTLGRGPAVSRVTAIATTQTSLQIQVSLTNTDGNTHTVRMRYREEGELTWTTPTPATQDTMVNPVNWDLINLVSDTTYEFEATIGDNFGLGVQRGRFTTHPPAVDSISVPDATIMDNEATVEVTVAAANGDPVYLRFREGSEAWTTVPSEMVAVGDSTATFQLTGLIAGTNYQIEASYDSSFPRDSTESASFRTTGTRPSDTAPGTPGSPSVGGSFGGGGGGGGAPAVVLPSDEDLDYNKTKDIPELAAGHETPTGMWSDGRTLWLIENSESGDDLVYGYALAQAESEEGESEQDDSERDESVEEEGEASTLQTLMLDRRNRFAQGLWSNGTHLWVVDSGQDRVFVYVLATGEREEGKEFELAEENANPRGIWSDGETLYVLDSSRRSLLVYNLATGELVGEYPLAALNASPRGIWSDGLTFWVSDDGAKRIFAYRFEQREEDVGGETQTQTVLVRYEVEEFSFRSLIRAGNSNARGIWSDGDVMYVADEQDDKVYSYNMPDATNARLATLTLSGIELGEFSAEVSEYRVSLPVGLSRTTVSARAVQAGAQVTIAPADVDGDAENGHQVELERETKVTVTVVSEDGSRTRTYEVALEWVNTAPVAGSAPRLSLVAAGEPGRVALGELFTDADGDALSYTVGASSDSSVAAVAERAGVLTVTPLAVGEAQVELTASDGQASSATLTLTVQVAAAPVPQEQEAEPIEVRISARNLAGGSVEFALQLREEDESWSARLLPELRFMAATVELNAWRNSSALELGEGEASRTLRISARNVVGGSVEFALQVRGEDGEWSERILPRLRFMSRSIEVNAWRNSSTLSID